jgi:hypothetical protein
VDTGRRPIQERAPGLSEPVVDHLAVGGVRVGGYGVGHVGDAADEHRTIDAVTFQVGQLFGGVEAGVGLGDHVAHRTGGVGGDVGLRAFAAHHR